MSSFNTLSIFGLIIIFNFIYSINGQTLCPASNCPDKSFCAGKDAGNYQNPQDDQTCFISCDMAGNLYCMACPENLVYDPASDSCDYPPTSTNEQPEQPQGMMVMPWRRLLNGEDGSNCPDKSFCTGKSGGNYQNPVNYPQTYYISCDMAQNLYCMSCAADLVYDPASDRCEYPPSQANEVNQPASMMIAEQTETKDGEEPNTINGNDAESSVTATNEQESASIVMAQQSETEEDEETKEERGWPKGPVILVRRLIDAITGNDESDATTAGQEGDEEPAGCLLVPCGKHWYCCM